MSKSIFTHEEDEFIKENYMSMQYEDIGKAIGKSEGSIRSRKHYLGLSTKKMKGIRSGNKNSNYKHGLTKHPIYNVWQCMKGRCTSYKYECYHRYGGRGISVCKEWNDDFQKFYDWAIENGWKEGLEIDRIDNDGNYEPSNCRCVTPQVNTQNQSTTKMNQDKVRFMRAIKKDCIKITMRELGEIFGISEAQAAKICRNECWSNI